ncbi:MAG: sodium:solute symporter family transporter [Mucilaginibacter sp.]
MNLPLSSLDFYVLVAYLLALLFIGFYLNKKNKSGKDIFLGGRTLKWWEIGFSVFSANAGPMMLVGFSSIGFSYGMVGGNFEWLAWIFLLLLSMFFLPHYIAIKINTLPQFLERRFGKRCYNFLVIYSLISILLVWLGSALYAGGLLISQIFSTSLFAAIVVIAIIATSITAIGGLKAVVRIGVFQSIVIIASSVILTFLGLQRIGGISHLLHSTPANYWKLFRPASDPEYSWIAVVLGYPVVAVYYWCADQTIVQKLLAAENIKQGQYGSIFISVLKIIMPLIFVLPGIMCFALFRNITQPDNAYITFVKQLMPHGLLGLCIAAIIAALIDTVSSGLNSFSTVFTLDVASRLRVLTENQQRSIGRWASIFAVVIGVILAMLFAQSGKGFFELSQGMVSILAPPITVVFVFGILWKRVNGLAAEIVLYGGGLTSVVIAICNLLNFPHKGYWPNFLLLSFYLFVVFSVVVVLVTIFSKRDTLESLPSLTETNRKQSHQPRAVWLRWAAVAVVMIIIYWLFN